MPSKLGQNFLINKEIVKRVVEAAELKPTDFVLEIGPGKGILTEELAKNVGKVVAIEIDKNLVEILKNKFKDNEKVEVVEGDIMKIKIQKSKCKMTNQNVKIKNIYDTLYIIPNTDYKIVANIPYYITASIIRKFLESDFPPNEMILMVQKEVAERICSKPGQMSILAVATQYYAQPEILFNVSRENFEPAPKVDSSVIKISNFLRRGEPISKSEREDFFRVVRAGFCSKRKTLINNLSNSLHLPKKEAEQKLGELGIGKNVRAQELSVKNWKQLARLLVLR